MAISAFLIENAPLLLSACSLLFSVLAWRKSRVVYEVVTSDNRPGSKLNELLNSGKYTILHDTTRYYTFNRTPPIRSGRFIR